MSSPTSLPVEPSEAWAADVLEAIHGRNWDKAIRLSEYALSKGIEHPRLLQVRAVSHERCGRIQEAVADLERAHSLAPDDPGVANALGVCLLKSGRIERSMAILAAAVEANPRVAESWRNLATTQIAGGRLAEAKASFERLLDLEPDAADALGKLAVLASHRGDRGDARLYATRALDIEGDNPDAHRALIEADLGEKRFPEAENGARMWLESPDMGANARHHALGLLGDALDGQGDAGEAFKVYSESGDAFRRQHAKSFAALETTPLRSVFATMASDFASTPPQAWAREHSLQAQRLATTHVFLLGFMRSGTTLLEQALGQHPAVVSLEEVEAFAEAGAELLNQPGGMRRLASLNHEESAQYRAAYWSAVEKSGVSAEGRVLVDKLPFNGAKLPLIAKLFPDAKIVFALRDPRDVVLSCFQRRLQPNGYAYEMATLGGAARLYDAYMSLVQRYRETLDLSVLDHRHERLVADFEGAVRAVCRFIGLDFIPEMAAFPNSANSGHVLSQTSRQLSDGLSAQGVGRWRAYAADMDSIAPLLRPWVLRYGYSNADEPVR